MSVDAKARAPYAPGVVARAFLILFQTLPPAIAAMVGDAFGWLAAVLDRKRGRIVARNLEICFPEFTPAQRHALARQHFRAFGRAVFCALALGGRANPGRVHRVVRLAGEEHFTRAVQAGRHVILLAPHFVGLELGWLRLSADRPMCAMYREPRRHLFHWAIHENRTRFGGILIEREANPRVVLRQLAAGRPLYYLPDIDPGVSGGHAFVPFFGTPAATVTALSRFARLGEAVVIPCITRELARGRYETRLHPPIENFPTDDAMNDTARINRWIEDQARQLPSEYFWVHRRFKTRPGEQGDLYGHS